MNQMLKTERHLKAVKEEIQSVVLMTAACLGDCCAGYLVHGSILSI
jgi:hypothetical protein